MARARWSTVKSARSALSVSKTEQPSLLINDAKQRQGLIGYQICRQATHIKRHTKRVSEVDITHPHNCEVGSVHDVQLCMCNVQLCVLSAMDGSGSKHSCRTPVLMCARAKNFTLTCKQSLCEAGDAHSFISISHVHMRPHNKIVHRPTHTLLVQSWGCTHP